MDVKSLERRAIKACEQNLGWKTCAHWKANLVLVIATAIAVAVSMRAMLGALLLVVPLDSWAGTVLIRTWLAGDGLFFASAFVSTFGGATSLLRELRTTPEQSFSILHAVGHMFSAQFSGLMTLVGCLYANVPPLLALLACGMAGWAGNAWLVRLDKWTGHRVFPEPPSDDPK